MLEIKSTFNGWRPQNIKRWISQQPLIGSSSNFKLKFRGQNQNQKCLKLRRTPIKDNLKLLKVEYLSNCWSYLPPFLNLSSGDQTKTKMLKMKMISNGRQHQTIQSWIYQQLLIGSSSNYKLKLRGLYQNQNAWNEDDLQWKTI